MTPVVHANAVDRLIEQFKRAPVLRNMLLSFLARTQTAEDALHALKRGLMLPPYGDAAGAAVDLIGSLVGEPRLGRDDAQYIPAIWLRVRVNRSKGRSSDIVDIARIANNGQSGLQYEELPPLAFRLQFFGVVMGLTHLAKMIVQAKAAGSRAEIVLSDLSETETFVWGDANNPGTLRGWGDANNPGSSSPSLSARFAHVVTV